MARLRTGMLAPAASGLVVLGLLVCAALVYVVRPLELGQDSGGDPVGLGSTRNTLSVGLAWLIWAVMVLVAAGIAASRRPAGGLWYGIIGFGLVVIASIAPALQMHNQLESIVPSSARPDLAGTPLRIIWLSGAVSIILGSVMVIRRTLAARSPG